MTFPIPRPKAAEARAKLPRRTNRSKAPLSGTLRDLPMQPQRTEEERRAVTLEAQTMNAIKDSIFNRRYGKRTAAERARENRKEIRA